MANDQNLVLVFDCGPGTRFPSHHAKIYYAGEDEIGDGRRDTLPTTKSRFDDEIQRARHFTPEQGVRFRNFMRGQGYRCHLENRFGDALFEREQEQSTPTQDRYAKHSLQFIPIQGGGYDGLNVGFVVKHNPQRGWYIRAVDVPSMAHEYRDRETLWDSTPQGVIAKLIEQWGLKIAIPYPDPEAVARAEQERKESLKNNLSWQLPTGARMRPGSV